MAGWAPGNGVWWSLPPYSKHIHLSLTNVTVVGGNLPLHGQWTPLLSDAWLLFFLLVLYSHWRKLIGSWTLLNSYGWTEPLLTIVLFSDTHSSPADRIDSVLNLSARPESRPQTELPLRLGGSLQEELPSCTWDSHRGSAPCWLCVASSGKHLAVLHVCCHWAVMVSMCAAF